MINFFSKTPITILVFAILIALNTRCEAENKKPFSQLGFDQSESKYEKPKKQPVDKITEILKAFSEPSEPAQPAEKLENVLPKSTPTPESAPVPLKRGKPLSQID